MRVSGAQMLAAAGVELAKIEMLARWSSPMVLHYARLAPMKAISKDLVNISEHRAVADSVADIKCKFEIISEKITAIEAARSSSEAGVPRRKKRRGPGWIINCATSTVHQVSVGDDPGVHPLSWQASCGWRFGQELFAKLNRPPDESKDKVCKRCLARAANPEIADSESSTISESSS